MAEAAPQHSWPRRARARAPARPSPGVGLALPTDAEKASRTVPSGDLPLVKHLSSVLGSFTCAVETSRLSLDYLSEHAHDARGQGLQSTRAAQAHS